MQIVFLSAASAKESWFDLAESAYLRKINGFYPTECISVKTPKLDRSSSDVKKREEEKSFLKAIEPQDFVILLDENGKLAPKSEEFSKHIVRALESGKPRLIFLIGGAYGVTDAIRTRANLTLSLSTLTMNHLVAQTMLYEQVYRALAIWKNLPYHNPAG